MQGRKKQFVLGLALRKQEYVNLTMSGSTDCLQTIQSQLTVIQVPHHGEFASLGQYY